MNSLLHPWQLLLLILAGWINLHQQKVIECLRAGNQAMNEKLGKIACRERLGGMLRYYYRRAA